MYTDESAYTFTVYERGIFYAASVWSIIADACQENTTVHRNGIGHIKRSKGRHDYRMKHALGAMRLVVMGQKEEASLPARFIAWLRK